MALPSLEQMTALQYSVAVNDAVSLCRLEKNGQSCVDAVRITGKDIYTC